MTIPSLTLNDGRSIPSLGLGTYKLDGVDGTSAMTAAIDSGYRLLDTALNYGNEREVGDAVRAAADLPEPVTREELVVTSKLPGRHHGYDEAIASLEESLGNLRLDYVDLYLIHWPLPKVDRYVDAWRGLIELRDRGLARSIGVSNFTPAHLTRLIEETGVTPAVNQVELHPRFPQTELREFHAKHSIVTESWSPLGSRHADFTDEPVIRDVASELGVTPTQVVLRWHVQVGAIPLPKSGDRDRQRENLDVFGFELTREHLDAIATLESGRLWGGDPETHEEF
ncbi:aldo/keto reductase [Salinibacterium sp. SYSU T00001]|uniref:aldo/keto reductase n=1 Tax=Homoserinimonas sedimenticola TaxID=2986805 RepID=UPI002235F7A0|nr:aldo/keto reductase [Salinibacterium sedimenticola]MCW4386516.1 aldo/keto reductase [Salinibacterium sedimenticola]